MHKAFTSFLLALLLAIPAAAQTPLVDIARGVPAQEYVTTTKPFLSAFKQCLDGARTQPCYINIIGDSRSVVDDTRARVGPGGSPLVLDLPYGYRWADLLRQHLQAIYGSHGTGVLPLSIGIGDFFPNPDHYTFTGSLTKDATLGPYQINGSGAITDAAVWKIASGGVITFTGYIPYDTLRVLYETVPGGGIWTVAVDGVTAGTLPSTGSVATARLGTFGPFPLATHTVSFTCAGGSCLMYANEGVAGSSGVSVSNTSEGSASLENYAYAPSTQLAFSDLIPHSLDIVAHLTNEPGQGISTAQFNASLNNLYAHESALGASMLFLSPSQDNIAGQTPYFPVLKAFAQLHNVGFLDFRDRYGPTQIANMFGPDGAHENKAGNADEDEMIEAALFGATLPSTSPQNCTAKGMVSGGFDVHGNAVCIAPPMPGDHFCGASYSNSVVLTLDHTKVKETLYGFPLLLSFNGNAANDLTLAGLKSVSSGGNVQTSSGLDIVACSAAGYQLPHERVGYDGATGKLEMYVTPPVISAVADTPIVLFWGKANAPDTSRPNDVWSNGYGAVYHFSGANSSAFYADSSPWQRTLGYTGSPGGGVGAFGVYAILPAATSLVSHFAGGLSPLPADVAEFATNSDGRTIESWYKFPSPPPDGTLMFGYGDYNSESNFSVLANSDPTQASVQTTAVHPRFTLPNDAAWHYVAASLPQGAPSAAQLQVMVDGALVPISCTSACGSDYKTMPIGFLTLNGLYPPGGGSVSNSAAEYLDEVRFSNVYRSPGWLSTEYANMSSPATFFSLSAATTYTATSCAGTTAPHFLGGLFVGCS